MNIQTVTFNKMSFVHVTSPGELEIKYLKTNFGFDSLHLDDYLNKTQIPKIESAKNYTLVVLDFPYFNPHSPITTPKEKKMRKTLGSLFAIPKDTLSSMPLPQLIPPIGKTRRLFSSQVDFFIGKDFLVVLHDGTLSPINEIFAFCQKSLHNRNEYMGQGSVFLVYRIIDALVDNCFPIINELSGAIDKIDKELENRNFKGTIEDISITRRNVVVFHTMIKPVIPLFKQLEEGKYKELNGPMQPFWGNILDHLQKIWDRVEDNQELVEGISESNESLLAFRSNELVKFFTVLTSISFPFVLINNLYSMNVAGLPYAQSPWIVWVLFSIIFVSGVTVIIYFKLRDWL